MGIFSNIHKAEAAQMRHLAEKRYSEIAELRAQLAKRDARIKELADVALRNGAEVCAQIQRITALEAGLREALDALSLPCDRWNGVQWKIVKKAIANINKLLGGESNAT